MRHLTVDMRIDESGIKRYENRGEIMQDAIICDLDGCLFYTAWIFDEIKSKDYRGRKNGIIFTGM